MCPSSPESTFSELDDRWIETARIEDPAEAVTALIELGLEHDARALGTAWRTCRLIEANRNDEISTIEKKGAAFFEVGKALLQVGKPRKARRLAYEVQSDQYHSEIMREICEFYRGRGKVGQARRSICRAKVPAIKIEGLRTLAEDGDNKSKRKLLRLSRTRQRSFLQPF